MKRFSRGFASRYAVVSAALVAVVGGSAYYVRSAWPETLRREAYLSDLQTSARHDPNERTLALLGGRLVEAGRYEEAARVLEKSARGGATQESVWRTWAASCAVLGQLDGAKSVLDTKIQAGEADVAPVRVARTRLTTLESPTPDTAAQAICPNGPKDLVRDFGSGSLLNGVYDLWAQRNVEASGFAYRQQQALSRPNDVDAQLRWADALRRNRRLREAETVATAMVSQYPKNPEAHCVFAAVLFDGGATAKAGVRYGQALRLRQNYLPALIGLGNVAVEMKLVRVGLDTFHQAVKVAPNDAEAWIGLGRAYLNQRLRWDKAQEYFEKARVLAPQRTDFYVYLADALRSSSRFDEAERLLRQRLQQAPEDARCQYMLALTLMDGKSTPQSLREAETLLRTSLKIAPGVPVVQMRLAQILLDKNEPTEAGPLLIDALERLPRETQAIRLLARSYQMIGQPDKANQLLESATRIGRYNDELKTLEERERENATNVAVHRELAKAYTRGGEHEKARRQQELVYMLTRHRAAASKGVTTFQNATTSDFPATAEEVARGKGTATGAITP